MKGIDVDNFFPRAYVLSEKNDLEDFLEDFKVGKAFAVLKKYIEKSGMKVNKEMVLTAYNIIKRREKFLAEEEDYVPVIKTVKEKVPSFFDFFIDNDEDDDS